MVCQLSDVLLRSLESRIDPSYKVEVCEGLGFRHDVLEDGTNMLSRYVDDKLLIEVKQHPKRTKTKLELCS
jgi:hypothetical protein